jgi:dopamine beta-monooxygenase
MLGADMFTAYSTGASTCDLQDRMAMDKALPTIDTDTVDGFEDWNMTSCSLAAGVFTVAADRAFETFDFRDRDFVTGPMTLVFAWGQSAPADANSLTYHDGGHEPKSLSLWGEVVKVFNVSELESDYDTQVIQMTNVSVDVQNTYICQGFNLTQKDNNSTQAIVFNPIISPALEPFVHHMVLHICTAPASTTPFACPSMPSGCANILYAWGKGGGPFVLPSITGIQIGGLGRMNAVLQVHYYNPENVSDIFDNTGVEIYRTNLLRQTQSALLVIGTVNFTLIPGIREITVSNYCPSQLTSTLIPVNGITAYSSFMHEHQRGRRMWSEVWRNGSLFATLGNNQNFDFNLQKVVSLTPSVVLKKNDTIKTYCTYDTTHDSVNVTHGETTANEMCLNFIFYYPAIGLNPFSTCVSTLSPNFPGLNPGPQMCSLLPGDPPAAYTVSGWTTANMQFLTGGNATCAEGFNGTAVLGCAGWGAPYTFSGCSRPRRNSTGTNSTDNSTLPPTAGPALSPAVSSTLPIALLICLAASW